MLHLRYWKYVVTTCLKKEKKLFMTQPNTFFNLHHRNFIIDKTKTALSALRQKQQLYKIKNINFHSWDLISSGIIEQFLSLNDEPLFQKKKSNWFFLNFQDNLFFCLMWK